MPAAVFVVGALLDALAGTPPAPVRVLIWPERGTSSVTDVEAQVARDLRTRVPDVALPDALPAGSLDERQKADQADRARVETAVGKARDAYLAFNFDVAREALAGLLGADLPVVARDPAALWRVLVLAAQVDHAAGAGDAAMARLRLAVRLGQPAEAATVGPPELGRMLADARREAQASPRAPLKLTSEPAGATVRLDGSEAGRTPLVVEVAQGGHVVALEMPGRAEAARLVEVDAAGSTEAFTLAEDPGDAVFARQIFAGRFDTDDPASRAVLLERTRATHLATYRQTFFGPEFHVRKLEGEPAPAGRFRAGSRDVADRIADIVLGVSVPPTAVARPPVAAATPAPPAWWARGWVWAAAGVVVVAAGAAAYMLVDRPAQHATVRPL